MTTPLLEPSFIDRDPQVITAELVAQYEFLTGKTLYPAQVERVFIDIMAIRETLVRVGIQEAAKQNLLAYARAPILDYLGAFFRVERLPAEASLVTLSFTLAAAQATDKIISAGTRVDMGSANSIAFATLTELVIVAGQTEIIGFAECTTAGIIGNDIELGALNSLIDATGVDGVTVANTTISTGGYDGENDDQLRERIKLAPEAFSTAGCRGAYVYHARSASAAIIDVAVVRAPYGNILIYPLTSTGLPSSELLANVEAACDDEKKRPLSDEVHALAPTVVPYQLRVRLYPNFSTDGQAVLNQSNTLANTYTETQAKRLGQDIVPSQIDALLSNSNVWRVEVLEPASPLQLEKHEWAVCTDIQLTLGAARYG